jgi:hypothetical protein
VRGTFLSAILSILICLIHGFFFIIMLATRFICMQGSPDAPLDRDLNSKTTLLDKFNRMGRRGSNGNTPALMPDGTPIDWKDPGAFTRQISEGGLLKSMMPGRGKSQMVPNKTPKKKSRRSSNFFEYAKTGTLTTVATTTTTAKAPLSLSSAPASTLPTENNASIQQLELGETTNTGLLPSILPHANNFHQHATFTYIPIQLVVATPHSQVGR